MIRGEAGSENSHCIHLLPGVPRVGPDLLRQICLGPDLVLLDTGPRTACELTVGSPRAVPGSQVGKEDQSRTSSRIGQFNLHLASGTQPRSSSC